QLDEMGKALHRVAWELRPASIDELGLSSALANHIAEWSHQFGIEADFHCRDSRLDELAQEMRTTIYRIVQEALTNVARHARESNSVSVFVDRTGKVLHVTIEDNGCGFDPNSDGDLIEERLGRHLGLVGMRERLFLVGGSLQ